MVEAKRSWRDTGEAARAPVLYVRVAADGIPSRWPCRLTDELQHNLQEVVGMLLEDGEPQLESEFVGVHTIKVA
jgi:hypothetical protein